jgi:hypothetical protein
VLIDSVIYVRNVGKMMIAKLKINTFSVSMGVTTINARLITNTDEMFLRNETDNFTLALTDKYISIFSYLKTYLAQYNNGTVSVSGMGDPSTTLILANVLDTNQTNTDTGVLNEIMNSLYDYNIPNIKQIVKDIILNYTINGTTFDSSLCDVLSVTDLITYLKIYLKNIVSVKTTTYSSITYNYFPLISNLSNDVVAYFNNFISKTFESKFKIGYTTNSVYQTVATSNNYNFENIFYEKLNNVPYGDNVYTGLFNENPNVE